MRKYVAILFLLPFFLAADWPMFHGPKGDNRSPDTGLLTSFSEIGPPLIWESSGLGVGQSGFSSMTIADNRIFTAGSRDGKSIVYCLDRETGKKLWEYENGGVWTKSYGGTRSTPTVDDNRVYDLSSLGELVCLDVKTGLKIWGRNILTDFEGENIIWALAESVYIDGDRLICSPGGKKASVVALDKMTGKTVWETPSTGEKTSYSSAVIFEQDGLRVLAMMYAKGLLGINADTGELLFTHRHTQRYDINCTKPLYHNGKLLIVNAKTPPDDNGAALLRVTVDGKKASVEKIWQNRDFDNLHDGVLLLDGYLYGSSYNHKGGVFMCVEWETGKIMYDPRDCGRGAVTFAEGLIYFLSEKGDFRLIRPTPEKYDVVSRWSIPEKGEGPTWAHMVVLDRKLYIRHGEYLYCYDIAEK